MIKTDNYTHIKLYFNHYIVLSNTIRKAIAAQGFTCRLDQYEDIKPLPETFLGESRLVKHKNSNQIFELAAMSQASLADEAVANEYWERIRNLKKLNEVKKVKTIVDCFQDDQNVYCVRESVGDLTLASVIQESYAEGSDEDFAQKTLSAVATIINSMHKRGYMHRRISADIVGMRFSSTKTSQSDENTYKVTSMGGLDRVFAIKP